MRVRLVTGVAGNTFAYPPGIQDIPDELAISFLRCGHAVPVEPSILEVATAPEPKRVAVLPSRKRR